MGQKELLDLLIDLRRKEPNKWYGTSELLGMVSKDNNRYNKRAIYSDLYKLTTFGFLEYKGIGLWKHQKYFRAKLP
jgi:hypothetical protein